MKSTRPLSFLYHRKSPSLPPPLPWPPPPSLSLFANLSVASLPQTPAGAPQLPRIHHQAGKGRPRGHNYR
ncbi:hypothetical protein E2C01_083781 [Portunus trituberculatus]|uniref:Uncharacterized protein n=1 Tax=Portunus trituberculatus TaxID=210409 RepID=A0A5B7J2K3_PORTR|nr:hypothetical protein [Portunus trituberculatus]